MKYFLTVINYLGPLLSLVGTYCMILSYTKYHEIEHTIKNGKEAEGKVIKMREDHEHSFSDKDYRGKAPVVEFRTQNGLYQHFSTTYRKNSQYVVGQSVKIYYYKYKSRMEMALADDESGTVPKKWLMWGVIFCAIGYPILLAKLSGFFISKIS